MKTYYFLFVVILFSSCLDDQKYAQTESWMSDGFIDSTQILLTNQYSFRDLEKDGASSFLIASTEDTFLCTAKHLLGDAMGFIPEIPTIQFDTALDYWKAFPRTNKLSSDTVAIQSIINSRHSPKDVILLTCSIPSNSNLQVLQPRLSRIEVGETLYLIGCEYSDSECHQRLYETKLDAYYEGMLSFAIDSTVQLSGFSGAPILDEKGYVVGVLSAGYDDDNGIEYCLGESINAVRRFLW